METDYDKLIQRRSELCKEMFAIDEQVGFMGSLKGRYFKSKEHPTLGQEYIYFVDIDKEKVIHRSVKIITSERCTIENEIRDWDTLSWTKWVAESYTEITSTEFKEAYQKALEQLSNLLK